MMTFLSTAPRGRSTFSTSPSSSTSFERTIFILSARSARSARLQSPTSATSSRPRVLLWTPTRWRLSWHGRRRTHRGLFAASWASQGTIRNLFGSSASSRSRSRACCDVMPSPGMRRPLRRLRPSSGPSRRVLSSRCPTSTVRSWWTATPSVWGSAPSFIRATGRLRSSAGPSPHAIISSWPMSGSSLAWCRPCATRCHICGGRPFRIRTDHYSLKFLLDQRLSTVPQHQWISKLFGFDFTIEYRPGCLNTVADTLSRRDADHDADAGDADWAALCICSGPSFALIDDIRRATTDAPDAQLLRQRLDAGDLEEPWRLADGLLLHGRRLFVPDHGDLRHQVLLLAHSTGHEGVQNTLHRLRADFYIPGDWPLVRDWVWSCVTCQRNKTKTLCPAGLLHRPWRCPLRSGPIFPWISSRASPRWAASPSSSRWSTASPSTHTSSRSAIPTPPPPWLVPSSTALSAYTGFPLQSSATGTRCSRGMFGAISSGWRA
nr:uncharacterized protein LOC123494188 isoform X1 [Aegilops tauschii subsp. strangulata]XP_045085004.1 uncharacterized protein LOC123494188 isoform X1 [Aegilops tauschii subsp. strangulata]